MSQVELPLIDYAAITPILVILGAACLGVLVEAFLPRHQRWSAQVGLSLLALVAAGVALALHARQGGTGVTTLSDSLAIDAPTLFLWGTLLALGLGAILLIADRSVESGGAFVAESNDTGPAGAGEMTRATAAVAGMRTEVFPLALFALGGMMVFCAANDLLTMFIALEVLSLPLYLMCGLAKRRRLLSQEAAVKYFLLGAFASAFFLYGLALLYGYAGSVKLSAIAAATAGTDRSDTLLFAGLGLLVVGLLFKASVGPFHTWTPDVYQGAPTAVTGFMAACTKVAAFGGILRVLQVAFEASSWEWRGVLYAVAIVSMAIGVVLGLTQSDIKRMIAYSSVAHAGFLLVGSIALTERGLAGTMFYLLAYGFTTIAIFGVISLVRTSDGEATHLSDWAGLAKRSPVVAWVFTFLLLALAGIPMTSGFVGKFVVFEAALADGMAPLVVVALVASAVAAFFYLRVIVLMHFSEPAEDGPTVSVPGAFTTAAITLGVVVTLLLGVLPSLALDWANLGGFVS
ncbi:NADH dehydrogenase subunit N [Saccharopolyspora erythraea NRRL 2338]|uniref:NADH-quinone oxidoreductase subunit N n=2 Tax=Saccharopolyspora erythraea TaxID=1836 RepID=NUON_SACEN|nr:NADH-quinone oxidoreductase subunit NuoN [Saccharopolyspora erythraea]A4FPS8.1 RecName: Full=NADH-quinone oxidoreductase subunit N; AltName: Full=NADH dehydrogenase I subunit N; AltName: Full=NDH-1 subunit N [Saccharopolyspora erythraea NRRL 2338]EQD86936.1 NADH:ubiquinone oxidoreductase subunit N [Saccharopolyspora erythraea D]PFG99698.1 NADH dehydrogenase subunit N [Saccharopolyspora erythraea NRRL 2338]QRK89583.1 NADH-quinone oxidoreductase subunit NuoN [Saccharopolyspora erythraea]CAM06